MLDHITNYIANNLSSIVQAGLIFVATIILAKLTSLFITSNMKLASKKLGAKFTIKRVTRIKLIRRLIIFIIYFVGLALALYQFESVRNLGKIMFASVSVLGIVFAMAARTSLANIIAGLMISFSQPVRLGDFVEIEGQEGKIEDITLTYTIIKTWDNKRLIIPNKKISDSKIINYSIINPVTSVKVIFLLDYKIDWGQCTRIIINEVKKSKFCLAKKEPRVQIVDLDKGQIKAEIVAWTQKPETAWDFSCQIKENLLKLFNEKKLSLKV
jgi:small-conductance mechanosensitive channel